MASDTLTTARAAEAEERRKVENLADFAYEMGFHEMGYDPIAALVAAVEQRVLAELREDFRRHLMLTLDAVLRDASPSPARLSGDAHGSGS